jgi:hypothetical protein
MVIVEVEGITLKPLTYLRAVSSVGLEHYLDRVGVTGSNPVQPTLKKKGLANKC